MLIVNDYIIGDPVLPVVCPIAELIPARKIRKNKPKLKVWNEEIKRELKDTRIAHKETTGNTGSPII
jgi:hypothetical protein